jgi:hypothetical protein
MLIVRAKSVGSRRTLFADWSVPLGPEWEGDGGGEPTLRELIATLVRIEVDSFLKRAEARRLDRVLTPHQIKEGFSRGKISPEGTDREVHVDTQDAIDTAIQAFEDGLYLVVIDGEEYRDLDRIVRLRTDSCVTFIRLTFLAGA